jgi:TolA-binding protein
VLRAIAAARQVASTRKHGTRGTRQRSDAPGHGRASEPEGAAAAADRLARQDRDARGQIDEAKHELETTQQQQRDLYADLDRRLLLLENASGVATPGVPSVAPSPSDIAAADETTIYGDAFAALKAGRYEEAIRGFQLYLTKYPQGPRADNAAYWLGEAQYVQKDYDAALKSFQSVLEFPDSRRRLMRCSRLPPVRVEGSATRVRRSRT